MSIGNITRVFQGDADPRPEQVQLSPEQQEKYRRYFAEAATADERLAAEERSLAAAEEEYRSSFDGRTEVFREGEPPNDLKVSVVGLPPARTALVRYVAWLERERAELIRLIKARDGFFDAIGVPAVARAELDQIKASDNAGYLRWILDGATKAAQFSVDSFRRSQAEQRLSAATAEAETARAGLAGVGDLIAFQEGVVRILEGRRDRFVQAVVIEAIGPLAEQYEETVGHLTSILTQIGGAAHALHRRIGGVDQVLPSFGFANARLVVDEPEMRRASGRWTDLEQRLMADPRATLGGDR